jgi:hypothetical protein
MARVYHAGGVRAGRAPFQGSWGFLAQATRRMTRASRAWASAPRPVSNVSNSVGNATGRAFGAHNLRFPSRHGERIVWKPLTAGRARFILRNPIYAGAFVYGRHRSETILENGERRQRNVERPMSDWRSPRKRNPRSLRRPRSRSRLVSAVNEYRPRVGALPRCRWPRAPTRSESPGRRHGNRATRNKDGTDEPDQQGEEKAYGLAILLRPEMAQISR